MRRKMGKARSTTELDVAIVGGGIAGLYAAHRMCIDATFKNRRIKLFEATARIGGRLLTLSVPHIRYPVELGAMRFKPSHDRLNALVAELGLETTDFDIPESGYYLRGRKHNSLVAFIERSCHKCENPSKCHVCGESVLGRYVLGESKQREAALEGQLIEHVINKTLGELTFDASDEEAKQIKATLTAAIDSENFSAVNWSDIKQKGQLPLGQIKDVYLSDIGFWNLLYHFVGNEAFLLLHDSLGYESIVCNWNAADAIPWFVSEFGKKDWKALTEGFGELVSQLEMRIKARVGIAMEHQLEKCSRFRFGTRSSEGWKLDFRKVRKGGNVSNVSYVAKNVILALPRMALEGLDVQSKEWVSEIEPDLPAVQQHRMAKIFLIYEDPWWSDAAFLGRDSGKVITDLPLKQVYFFGPEWIKGHSKKQKPSWCMMMASYGDDHIVDFWGTFSAKVKDSQALGSVHFRKPSNWHELTTLEKDALNQLKQSRFAVRARMVIKVRHLLAELNAVPIERIPDPVIGVWTHWGDEVYSGGWHTWNVHKHADTVAESMVKGVSNLHICGEAYSTEQGWIEGAMSSAEAAVDRIREGFKK